MTTRRSFRVGLAGAANEYLARGLAIIALTGKTPNVSLHKHGLHDFLSGAPEGADDYEFVAKFFMHKDTTGIGILTSFPYVVVDIDGEEGAVQFQDLVKDDVFEEPRWVAKTGRGLHFWFATTVPTGTIKLGPKLDLKGDGGYVVAPPSLHPDGGQYQWLRKPGDLPPGEVPESIERIIEDRAFDLKMHAASKVLLATKWGPKYQEGDHSFFAQPGHDALIVGMATAAEGNRNNYLHWAAATLAEENGSDDEFATLSEAALAVGLEPVEVKRTLRSARRAHG